MSQSHSRERQKPCTWKELAEVTRNLPLPNVAEEDLADQAPHSTSSEEDSGTESHNTQSKFSEQGEEAVQDLHEEIATIFEATLSDIKNLSLLEGIKIGRSDPKTLGRRDYRSEDDQSPVSRDPTRLGAYDTIQTHSTFPTYSHFQALHKATQKRTMAHTPEKQKLPKFMGDGSKDPVRHCKTCVTIWEANG